MSRGPERGQAMMESARDGSPAIVTPRYVPPYRSGEDSLFFEAFNRGKRSISLDLRVPDGARAFRDLAGGTDVVFSNVRGDLPERLGLTYARLQDANRGSSAAHSRALAGPALALVRAPMTT